MKIVTPLSSVDNYECLSNAGADEFFAGYIPHEWLKRNSNYGLNRREVYVKDCNICDLDSMESLAQKVKKYGKAVKLTFNSLTYIPEHYPLILKTISQLMEIGFYTFIIADPALIYELRKHKIYCNIHLSGEISSTNRLLINYFVQYGVNRIIFSRKTTMQDMGSCIKYCQKPDTEFEAFVLNSLCPYTGAYCNSIHCDGMLFSCELPSSISRFTENSDTFKETDKALKYMNAIMKMNSRNDAIRKNHKLGENGCGLCRIKEMKDLGVTHLKVVGRGKELSLLEQDIRDIRDIIKLSEEPIDNNEFKNQVIHRYLDGKCPHLCYYPYNSNKMITVL